MLYAIWQRVIDENQSEISQDSSIQIDFLKESQFYMACKLVAIYQDNYNELMCSGKKISEVLTPDIINKNIQKALRIYAKFDFSKFDSQAGADSMMSGLNSLTLSMEKK